MKGLSAGMLGALLLLPSAVVAVSTQSFVIDTGDAFEEGTLEGTAAHASGKLTRAPSTTRIALDGAPVAYASAVGPDGAIYVGTGNRGAIHRVTKDGAKLFATTPAALVTSLVWAEGTLYAGTLPGGQVFAITADGKVRSFAKLEGSEHVWALAYGTKLRTLYAATGPEGKLFAIDRSGRAQVLHDDDAEHLLSLGLDGQERLYVGTSDGARLLRIDGRAVRVLYDFPGEELSAFDVGPDFVAVASNDFPEPPPPVGENKDLGATARNKRLKPGKGSVFALGLDGRVEELARFNESHVSALEIDPQEDAVQVGLGHEGRVIRLSRAGERAAWADVDERQIAAIHLQARVPHLLSSDGAAVHLVGEPARVGTFTSAALDATTVARFGELSMRARGDVRLATRSGNTEVPDATWSEWSAAASKPGPIKSPAARFLQIRAQLHGDAEVYALEAYYLPHNLPARVRNVEIKPRKEDKDKDKDKEPAASTTIPLKWEVENPDDDVLRYRLFARREGQRLWLPLQREHEQLEKPSYAWETRSIPDGHYRVRVVVSDEAVNPEPYVARTEAISAPLRVDNHAPELVELRFESGQLSGRAVDALGPISSLELSVDSAPYRPILPIDDLLDTREERFRVALTLPPGPHTLAVRAKDAADNVATAALEVSPLTP